MMQAAEHLELLSDYTADIEVKDGEDAGERIQKFAMKLSNKKVETIVHQIVPVGSEFGVRKFIVNFHTYVKRQEPEFVVKNVPLNNSGVDIDKLQKALYESEAKIRRAKGVSN